MITRDIVASAYVIHEDKILLCFHKKLQRWLPIGGHVEKHEIVDDAVIREVKEETGLDVAIIGKKAGDVDGIKALHLPLHVQLEDIEEGHQHIDFLYIVKVIGEPKLVISPESEKLEWFTIEELEKLDVNEKIKHFGKLAIEKGRD